MHNKNVLLGVTGGIAAYKSAELIRRLREAGANVQVIMTKAAKEFITPLTMQALSGNPVHDDLLDTKAEAAMSHIELARWADVLLVAPSSADFIAKCAHGLAEDLLTTVCLATAAPIVIAPAMNQQMWKDKITQLNIETLIKQKINILGPTDGSQACGDVGPGRMLEPDNIVQALQKLFRRGILEGLRVLITAGPTREYIDPVRFISNVSSGKMGYALAESCVEEGAVVTLITGPTTLPLPKRLQVIRVESTKQMYDAVMNHIHKQEIYIGSAAVCDYRPKRFSSHKLSSKKELMDLKLVRNPDIIKSVSEHHPLYVVGFAAQTEQLLKHAKEKLKQKSCDLLVANLVGLKDRGFESDNNEATVLWAKGKKNLKLMSKKQMAKQLVEIISEQYHAKYTVKNS